MTSPEDGQRAICGPWLGKVALIAVLYYVAARLGLTLQLPDTNASPVWPPSAIGFAAVILAGSCVWPGIAVGAFFANLHTLPATVTGIARFAAPAGICVGNTLEPLIGLWLLRSLVGNRNPLERARDVFAFIAAAGVGCLVASTNGATHLWAWNIVPTSQFGQVWLTWSLGDLAGILILSPAIFTLFQPSEVNWTRRRVWEAVGLFLLLAGATQFLFGNYRAWVDLELMDSLAYAVVPGLAWAAFRLGPRETALAAALISAIAIVNTIHESGPFYRQPSTAQSFPLPNVSTETSLSSGQAESELARRVAESLLMLQVFVLAIATTSALLAAAVRERNLSEQALRDLNATLEQRVVERTAELNQANSALQRSNQELDDFAYIASHDLKEPLRGISTYSGFLLEDYSERLDEDGREKLNTLQRLARRMESLIESLLNYSRLGRTELGVQESNLGEVLAEILDSLHVVLRERDVSVRIPEPLPTLVCDRVRVGEVFRNLITNAMKYNDKPERWIEIGFRNAPAAGSTANRGNGDRSPTVFHVRDNGIGIRDKHLDTVFRMFKRLHAREAFGGGTGVGLTIVKKIVERHGGRIWLESTYGEGTTFYFTLEQGEPHATSWSRNHPTGG